jgi:hypothetical protein
MVETTEDMTAQRPWARELPLGCFGCSSSESPVGLCSTLFGNGGRVLQPARQVSTGLAGAVAAVDGAATTTRTTLLLLTTTSLDDLDMASREADTVPMKGGDLVSGLEHLVVLRPRMELDAWQIPAARRATGGVTEAAGAGIMERVARGPRVAQASLIRVTRAPALARLLGGRGITFS